ncbi:MDR family MFS transporter [Corynebacterium cystitidis]|uniref:MFS transporter, DHA2 family, lincomycin resistance protein n=1 Tax=Corynebacterium cystitidis DSM 20524 TaxID=1121357 RepID=A0A1H9T5M9_9CORY|nr:MDR family MFS transporter [Corynebacterium cystitidis]WJY83448.1 Multidrug export protein EmrB [Corynebacterium cystitidis DSM 20524]SER91873.1 MFS transporter, DHA2 family, lincomycin resistance protein [Corynebacterium cystitidis DSM 20524]SNV61392.1 major facilitator superfamily permease [Corynebacterium cystitidis]
MSSSSSKPADRLTLDTVLIIAVLVGTTFVMMLNETALAVALPNIMSEFAISAGTAQWLLTGVMLTMAIMMPLTGWILDRFTTRQVYFFAVVFFLIGSAVAAISPSFEVMLLGRVLQAVGTAVVTPLQMTVVMTIVPPARRGTIMGLISIVMAVGPALGPTFAGTVMSMASWHMIFWIMVVLVSIPGLFGIWKLRNVGAVKKAPLDVVSAILSVFAFGGIVYGLSSIGVIMGGGSAATVALALTAVGMVGFVLFVWRQISMGKKGKALLNLAPLKIRNFVIAVVVIMLFQGVMLGASNTLPLYLQGALLTTALVAGLVNLPGGIVETVFSPFAGALYDRVGPRPLVIPGTIIGALSLYWMATVDHTTPVWLVMVMFAVFSFGLAMTLTPLMTTAMSSLPDDIYSHGSAILNTLMQLAGAAGTAVMITTFDLVSVAGGDTPESRGQGGAAAFLICAVLLTLAAIATFFLHRPELAGYTKTVAEEAPK